MRAAGLKTVVWLLTYRKPGSSTAPAFGGAPVAASRKADEVEPPVVTFVLPNAGTRVNRLFEIVRAHDLLRFAESREEALRVTPLPRRNARTVASAPHPNERHSPTDLIVDAGVHHEVKRRQLDARVEAGVCRAIGRAQASRALKGRNHTAYGDAIDRRLRVDLRAHRRHRHRLIARDGQRRDHVRRDQHQHAKRKQNPRRPVGGDAAPGQRLFGRDQPGDQRHPNDAHDPQREQRCHQRPAAADAPRPVLRAHPNGARRAVAPRADQEPERASALARQTSFSGVNS